MKFAGMEIDIEKVFHGATTVGERGQVVIPAQARRELEIEPGDKLLVFCHPFGSSLILTKTEALRSTIQDWLGKWNALEELLAREGKENEG
jgi:AbrB family looped-hinge helix DNA binding protein